MKLEDLNSIECQMSPVKRMEKKVAQGFMKDVLPRYCVFAQEFLYPEGQPEQKIGYTFTASELHHPLEYAVGKADGMVEGKYKKARFFGFEYKNIYVCCVTETGDRGSGWYFMDKESTQKRIASQQFEPVMGYKMFSRRWVNSVQEKQYAQELTEFFQFMGALLLHSLVRVKDKKEQEGKSALQIKRFLECMDSLDDLNWSHIMKMPGGAMYVSVLEQKLLEQSVLLQKKCEPVDAGAESAPQQRKRRRLGL